MFPRLVDFGAIELFGRTFHPALHTYGLLLFGGFLVGIWLAARRAGQYCIAARHIYDLALYLIVGALLGAKVLLIVLDPAGFLRNPLGFLGAGGVFFGGLLGAVAASVWFFRSRGISVWTGGDLMAPSLALGHGIGRLGCFGAGCCYGVPTDGPTAVTFTDVYANQATGVPLNTPVHPTQLYDAAIEFGLFFLLLWMAGRRRFEGQIFLTWAILYTAARFGVEFYRGDPRGFVFDELLSTSQFVGVWIVLAALIAWRAVRTRTV